MSNEAITRNDLIAILNGIIPSVVIIDFFYPIGSYYETSDITFNPNIVWNGRWELETSGQVHVSAGSGYTVNGALTNTSDNGAKTYTVANHTLTETELPKITGTFKIRGYQNSSGTDGSTVTAASGKFTRASGDSMSVVKNTTTTGTSHDVTYAFGSGGSHNHGSVSSMQPYVVVNRWHRVS